MANYTCEFSKIKDGDSTKYVQVPNENTAKRDTLDFADDFNHTPLRNLDKYKISCQEENRITDEFETVTYVREFKSDTKSGEDIIYCAFTSGDYTIYINHDDLTNVENDKPDGKYPVWTQTGTTNNVPTFTKDVTTTYTRCDSNGADAESDCKK